MIPVAAGSCVSSVTATSRYENCRRHVHQPACRIAPPSPVETVDRRRTRPRHPDLAGRGTRPGRSWSNLQVSHPIGPSGSGGLSGPVGDDGCGDLHWVFLGGEVAEPGEDFNLGIGDRGGDLVE